MASRLNPHDDRNSDHRTNDRGSNDAEPSAPEAKPPKVLGSLSLRFGIVALLMLATALLLQLHARNEVNPPRKPLASLPCRSVVGREPMRPSTKKLSTSWDTPSTSFAITKT